MEHKIKIEPAVTFHLPQEEQKVMYTYLALAQYCYLRKPNYNQAVLLRQLSIDMKKFLIESKTLVEQMPNNHHLHRIAAFFDNHHKQLQAIINGEPKEEQIL